MPKQSKLLNKNNMHMKVLLKFKKIYKRYYERGDMTKEQYDQLIDLLGDMGDMKNEKFEQKLKEIFPNWEPIRFGKEN